MDRIEKWAPFPVFFSFFFFSYRVSQNDELYIVLKTLSVRVASCKEYIALQICT